VVQRLQRDQVDSYGGEGDLAAIDDFFESLEAAQIRVAALTQSTSARTRRAKPAPATYRSPSPQSSSLSSPPPSPLPIMPTVLPKARDINLSEVSSFDGSPANLSLFDTHIRNALKRWDIPLYHGGTFIGSEEDGFSFCHPGTDQAKSNYTLGEKLCSGLANKFTGAVNQWWDDYDNSSNKPTPNYWKKATSVDYILAGVVEVSLYDLLVQQFDPSVDAQQVEIELESYRWNLLDKKALSVVPFRGHISRLCTRAGKTGWALSSKSIRNTFPD